MNKLIACWNFIRKNKYINKYVITLVAFFIIIVFIDENNIVRRINYNNEANQLRKEIKKYQDEYDKSTKLLNELSADSNAIERVAREKYLMKKPNEDIFVFEDK